jgi:putative nucleotidyltransferase with HDIG domain
MLHTSASFQNDAQDSNSSISLSEIISALSYALDLTEGTVQGHALRSCLLGMRIAAEAKVPDDQTSSLYFALLLKDVGYKSDAGQMYQVVGGDGHLVKASLKYEGWTKLSKPNRVTRGPLWKNVLSEVDPTARVARMLHIGVMQHHSEEEIVDLGRDRGASILGKLGMGQAAVQAIHSLNEHWDGSGYPDGMQREQIPLLARICAVAQHLDVFSSSFGVERAIDTLKRGNGTWFDPQLVQVALSLHSRGALWSNCAVTDSEDDTRRAVLDLDAGRKHHLEAGRIDHICEAFADVVDAKSNFTFRHSMGVADAAFGIATRLHLSAERTQLVRRAALLHDIGKLSVPNAVLDKNSALSAYEWKTIHQHPGISRSILERVGPFREMAVIAGEHHEKLDGSGYPNRLMAPDLSLESRIIAVADVYSALSEDRPYRPSLELDEVVSIMTRLVPYKLDTDCFEALVWAVSGKNGLAIEPSVHATTVISPELAFA